MPHPSATDTGHAGFYQDNPDIPGGGPDLATAVAEGAAATAERLGAEHPEMPTTILASDTTTVAAHIEATPGLRDELLAARNETLAKPAIPDGPEDSSANPAFPELDREIRPATFAIGSPLPSPAERLLGVLLGFDAMKFGEFKLKSGRISPYFVNFGLLHSGQAMRILGEVYAQTVLEKFGKPGEGGYDLVFGPPYKGIPIATHTAAAMAMQGYDVSWASYRKEAKDHGEGGSGFGAFVTGRRVLVVDDVMTAGTAVEESVKYLTGAGASVAGVVVGLDRMERGPDSALSAVQQCRNIYGVPVEAVTTLDDILGYLQSPPEGWSVPADVSIGDVLTAIEAYRAQYGADYSLAAGS